MTFKPKKQQIHVPGLGIVQKEDFSQEHFDILLKRAGNRRDEFIKQHFVVESYGDQPLFQESEGSSEKKGKGKKNAKSVSAPEPEKTDDEKLAEMIAQEEQENTSESEA